MHNIEDLLFKISELESKVKELEDFKAQAPTPIVNPDGSLYFADHGKYCNSGFIRYHVNGKLHRVDGPAIEHANGSKEWYIEDKRHRVDGPAAEYANGSKEWYIEGKRHRVDGPAVEYTNGYKAWYIEDKLHRVDGPAIISSGGAEEYYINDVRYTKEHYYKLIKLIAFI